jgi:hypothetical protein
VADSVMAILLSGTAQNLAAPLPIITDRSLLFTRALLLDAAWVKGELLLGFCHPGAREPNPAEGVSRKVCPGISMLSFGPACSVYPNACEFKVQLNFQCWILPRAMERAGHVSPQNPKTRY